MHSSVFKSMCLLSFVPLFIPINGLCFLESIVMYFALYSSCLLFSLSSAPCQFMEKMRRRLCKKGSLHLGLELLRLGRELYI